MRDSKNKKGGTTVKKMTGKGARSPRVMVETLFTTDAKALLAGRNSLLREELLNYISVCMFQSKGPECLRWFEQFVNNYLEFAKDNPDSKPAESITHYFLTNCSLKCEDQITNHSTYQKMFQHASVSY